MNGDGLSEMIRKIIENPEFAGMVSELRGDGDTAAAKQDMMEKLPDIMAMVNPMLGSNENEPKEEEKSKQEVKPVIQSGLKYDKNKAEKLMYALKPYLSQSRCDIIDKCVSVMQLSDVMGALGGLEGLLGQK